MPPAPSAPPAPTGNTSGAQPFELVNLLAGYTYSHRALHCAESFLDDEDTKHDADYDTDILTDEV
jgi:hypothetical protein